MFFYRLFNFSSGLHLSFIKIKCPKRANNLVLAWPIGLSSLKESVEFDNYKLIRIPVLFIKIVFAIPL